MAKLIWYVYVAPYLQDPEDLPSGEGECRGVEEGWPHLAAGEGDSVMDLGENHQTYSW